MAKGFESKPSSSATGMSDVPADRMRVDPRYFVVSVFASLPKRIWLFALYCNSGRVLRIHSAFSTLTRVASTGPFRLSIACAMLIICSVDFDAP